MRSWDLLVCFMLECGLNSSSTFSFHTIRSCVTLHEMHIRCILLLFVQLFSTVALEVSVEGFTGEGVILPCSYTVRILTSPETSIYWRFKDSKRVYDVTDGEESLSLQHLEFKNRTHTFPSEYARGNFSLSLDNLRDSDKGRYTCFLPSVNFHSQIDLLVKDKPVEDESDAKPRGKSVKITPEKTAALLLLLGQIWVQ